MPHWDVALSKLDCQALADHTTPKLQSRVTTFTLIFIFQFNTFFDRVWLANNQLCKRYILIYFWLNLAHNWLRGVAFKSRHATWPFRQGTTSKSTALPKLLFLPYISILYSYRSANSSRYSKIKTEAFYLFRSSRFVFLLSKSFDFSPRGKEEKDFFLLLKLINARFKNIPIYSKSTFSEDSESATITQKSQIFVEIPKKISFDLSQYSKLSSPIYSKTPLRPKNTNIRKVWISRAFCLGNFISEMSESVLKIAS